MFARYAVYFSPDDRSELGRFGSSVLGRTATGQRSSDTRSSFHDLGRWQSLTEKPAHYGFHATLKAPFELAAGFQQDDLLQACAFLATQQSAIVLDGLAPQCISNFAALTLPRQPVQLLELSNTCVTSLERFRAPINEHDIERRKNAKLTERQFDQLLKFGYPYVFDDFQFHMTLSSQLSDADKDYMHWLEVEYTQLVTTDPTLDRLAVFAQIDRNSAFSRIEEFVFA